MADAPLQTHVMHDIETFSTANNPVITALGAVKFNAEGIIDRFEIGIDPADCQRVGLVMDAGAVMFWLSDKQAEARKYLLEMGRIDLFSALDGYSNWLAETPKDNLEAAWANGATFDHIKLESAYRAVGLDFPFSYKRQLCYRTVSRLFPDVEFKRSGIHHGALDDAVSQAEHMIEIAKTHGLRL